MTLEDITSAEKEGLKNLHSILRNMILDQEQEFGEEITLGDSIKMNRNEDNSINVRVRSDNSAGDGARIYPSGDLARN